MGPAWDFDISSGNVNDQPIVSPTLPWTQTKSIWYKQLFTDPVFAADVKTQWNTLRNNGVFTDWVASIGQQGTTLSQSAQNNFARWPVIGETVWPNPSAQTNYADSVTALTDWINLRISYLDATLNAEVQSKLEVVSGPASGVENTPVSYAIRVTGEHGIPTGSVTLLLAGRKVRTSMLDVSGNATFTTSAPITGELHPIAVYNGDKQYAFSQASLHAAL